MNVCSNIVEAINSSISHIITLYCQLMVSSFIRCGVAHPIRRQFNITKCSYIGVPLFCCCTSMASIFLDCETRRARFIMLGVGWLSHIYFIEPHTILPLWRIHRSLLQWTTAMQILFIWILSCCCSTPVPCFILPCVFYSLLSSALLCNRNAYAICAHTNPQTTLPRTKRVKEREREGPRIIPTRVSVQLVFSAYAYIVPMQYYRQYHKHNKPVCGR